MPDLAELLAAHTAAMAAYDGLSDEEFERLGAELAKPVDATRDAILAHRPATFEEVATKAAFMTANRAFHRWDDFDQIKLIEALTPETVESLIAAHRAAWAAMDAACEATDDALGTEAEAAAQAAQDKAGDALAEAMDAIIEHPYSSLDELKIGMAYIVQHCRSTGVGDQTWLSDLVCNVAGIEDDKGGAS